MVVDSSGRPICITEVTEVRVVHLGAVDAAHAIDEGEGYQGVSDWRVGHEEFWHSPDFRAAMRDPTFTVSDSTEAVLVRFCVSVQRCTPGKSPA
ncbi:ASCH domain-containing protein [Arthrobacter sp. CG_A4]|uniref:ASCH domain-containing protein n=1 Tax=Arthrobacter sp. CG_A4 TaxID=3071706 RepID=UPI002E10E20C